jgi:outer membrane lipoprotein carrier protein
MLLTKKFLLTLATFIIIGFSNFIYAATPSDELTSLLLGMKTMQANFQQTVEDKSAHPLQSAQGKVSLERPGKFRWEIVKPNEQITIVNGSKLWIYDKDLQQVTINTFNKAAKQTPALLLSDESLTLSKDFTVQVVPTTSMIAGAKTFLLTPLDKDNMFASIRLSFLSSHITQMQLRDKLGHITNISFSNVKTGMSLPASLFTFKPTGNIDVIDATKDRR